MNADGWGREGNGLIGLSKLIALIELIRWAMAAWDLPPILLLLYRRTGRGKVAGKVWILFADGSGRWVVGSWGDVSGCRDRGSVFYEKK